MDVSELSGWLIEKAGPVIRYRILREIVREQDIGIVSDSLEGLFSSPMVQNWLERLQPNFGFHQNVAL